ncbi:MAG: IclR family transcriptional regulator [Anaerolineaceae bacterium]|nr:IclR family transcriptional regulator [Anaerolineaceae bacterium]
MSNVAVERALVLLKYIMDEEEGLSIREASRDLGYNPATVQKIVNAMNSQGFVVQDETTNRYHLGPEAIQLGLIALNRLYVHQIAKPHLRALSKETGETVFLAIARGKYAVYIDKVVSSQPIRMDAPLGEDRPFNCTAIGKVLLSGMKDEKIERLAKDGVFEKRTENSIYDSDSLKEEIALVRKQGWAKDNEEFSNGVICLAYPIFNHEMKIIAAITVSGPKERILQNEDEIFEKVSKTSGKISTELGNKKSAK